MTQFHKLLKNLLTKKKTRTRANFRTIGDAIERLESREVLATFAWLPTSPGAYNWNDSANWTGGPAGTFPNAVGDVANITSAITGNQVINLNVPVTVGGLNLGSTGSAGAFTIAGNGATAALTFDVAAGAAALSEANQGGDAILAPIVLNDGLTVSAGGASPISLGGAITGAATLTSTGTINLISGSSIGSSVTIAGNASYVSPPVLFSTSFYDSALYAFNADTGATLATLVAPNTSFSLQLPAGLTVGPDGNLYVSSQNNNTILRYNQATDTLDTFISSAVLQPIATSQGLTNFAPSGLRFGPDGDLYISLNGGFTAFNGAVIRFDVANTGGALSYAGTNSIIAAAGLGQPSGLAFGTAPGDTGNLYVANAIFGNVVKITGATGATPSSAAFFASNTGGLQFPSSLAFGPDGDLYVTDLGAFDGAGKVMRFEADGTTTDGPEPDGTFRSIVVATGSGANPGDLNGQFPSDLVFDANGRLLLDNLGPNGPSTGSNQYVGSVYRYSLAGVFNKALVTSAQFPNSSGPNDPTATGFIPSQISLTNPKVYTEGDGPLALLPRATVSDSLSADFTGGNLTVTTSGLFSTSDVIGIAAVGGISLTGNTVRFGGNAIGTFSGGNAGSPLVINFNTSAATPAAAQALVRAITFNNRSDALYGPLRTIAFSLTDGHGGVSNQPTVNLSLVAVNDAPSLVVPSTQAAITNTPVVFSSASGNALSIADTDAGTSQVQLSLSATNGTITLGSTTGLAFINGANGQSSITVQGTLSNLNAALNGLSFVSPTLSPTGTASLQLIANDLGNIGLGGALTASKTVEISLTSPATIVDNGGVGYSEAVGTWTTSGLAGFNGSATRFSAAANATVTWTMPFEPGFYRVEFYRVTNAGSSANATLSVLHNGQLDSVTQNLTTGPSGFVTVGTFEFSGNGSELVRLVNGTSGGVLRADAVRFMKVPLTTLIDNGTTGYTESGTWSTSSLTGYNNSSTRFASSATATATWTPTLPGPGVYLVQLYRVSNPTSQSNARLTLTHNGITEAPISIDLTGPTGFVDLGVFSFTGTGGEFLRLSQLTGGALRADAVRFTKLQSALVDNGTAGYAELGAWSNSGLLGNNSSSTRFSSSAAATATWTPTLPGAGTYLVQFYRVSSVVSQTNAKLTLTHNGVTETPITIDLTGPSGFVDLGTFSFNGLGGESLKLSQLTAGTLRADAVRFTRIGP